MVDNELLFQNVPFDQPSDPLDLAQYNRWRPSAPGFGYGDLIEFAVDVSKLQFDPPDATFPGHHLWVNESELGSDFSGTILAVAIGPNALIRGLIKFALPSNVNRFIRFKLEGNFAGGTYSILGLPLLG